MKTLKYLAAAALTLLAVSCNKEQVAPAGAGDEVTATFKVALPDAGVGTKATIADGTTVDQLIFAVYGADKNEIKALRQEDVVITNKVADVSVKLVKGEKYYFMFWGQKKGTGYYNTDDLKAVKINYDGMSNDETRDAFYAKKGPMVVSEAFSETITLHRPFAQINFGSSDKDAAAAAGLAVTESQVTVEGVYDTFNAFDNKYSGDVDVTYTFAATPDADAANPQVLTVEGQDYQYLAMNYVLAKNEKALVNLKGEFKLNNGKVVTVDVSNAPISKNYRTNILGDLLTVEGKFHIIVDEKFNGEYNMDESGQFIAAMKNGGNFKLTKDIVVPMSDSYAMVKKHTEVVIDLNGHNFTGVKANGAAIKAEGNLTINGEGVVSHTGGGSTDNAVYAAAGSKVIINGGTYKVGPDKNGKGNATIYSDGGLVEIYGGDFSTEAANENGYYFVLNQLDEIAENMFLVYGGTFHNYNPATGDNGTGKSYVAPGYESVRIDDNTWVVMKANPISTAAALKDAITSDEPVAISLANDVEIETPLVLRNNKAMTINLNGKSIVNKTQVNGSYTVVFNVTGNSHLTINGEGEVKALEETSDIDGYRMAVWAYDDAVVDINGGYFYNKQINPGTSNLIYVMDNAAVNITGGKFETAMLNAQGTSLLLNIYDHDRATAKINVTGGQFVAFNPADCVSEGPNTSFVPSGYKSEETATGSGIWTVIKE